MVHPFVDKEANMVLIEAVRGGKSRIKVEAPIVVYREPGVYTQEIYDIYGYWENAHYGIWLWLLDGQDQEAEEVILLV